jgi:predicted aminopeptidase
MRGSEMDSKFRGKTVMISAANRVLGYGIIKNCMVNGFFTGRVIKRFTKLIYMIPVLVICNCYLAKQATYLLKYNFEAQNIDRMILNKKTDTQLKEFLDLVNEVRAYAFDSIGLTKNKNYSTYVNINKNYLVNVVSASERVSFDQYKWCFPIVGCVPYKGFYERKDAQKEAFELSKKNYDVNIDPADAFSTLGFFKDPIYSFMRNYSAFELATVIIHEQTHATFYMKNQAQFNEELASFVGDEGGLAFVKMKYGENSREYQDAILFQKDYGSYIKLLQGLYDSLKLVYKSNTSNENKLLVKQKVISDFQKTVSENYDQYFKTNIFRGIGKREINNAYIAARMTYSFDLGDFYHLYEKNGRNLKETVKFFKSIKKSKTDPAKLLKEKLSQS